MNGRAIPGVYLFRMYVCDKEMSWPHHIGETHQPDWVVYVRDSEKFRLTNVIPERIIFVNRGITVYYKSLPQQNPQTFVTFREVRVSSVDLARRLPRLRFCVCVCVCSRHPRSYAGTLPWSMPRPLPVFRSLTIAFILWLHSMQSTIPVPRPQAIHRITKKFPMFTPAVGSTKPYVHWVRGVPSPTCKWAELEVDTSI